MSPFLNPSPTVNGSVPLTPEVNWKDVTVPVGGGGVVLLFAVNMNVVVWDMEPPAPVTVIIEDPVGVDGEVVTVIVEEHAGLHEAGEKAAVAPVGKPDAESDTDCAVPETSAGEIMLDTDCP
jgi:hypothetical protein